MYRGIPTQNKGEEEKGGRDGAREEGKKENEMENEKEKEREQRILNLEGERKGE